MQTIVVAFDAIINYNNVMNVSDRECIVEMQRIYIFDVSTDANKSWSELLARHLKDVESQMTIG